MTRILFVFILSLCISRPSSAQESVGDAPLPLSLDAAIDYALKNSDSLKNSRIAVELQRQKNREIIASTLPQLSAKDEFQHYPNQIQSFVPAAILGGEAGTFVAVPFTPKFANTASISGTQLLFDGSALVALQARKTIIELSELGVQATAQDVRYNVTRAYYGIVVSRRQLVTIGSSLGTIRDVLRDLTIMRDQGFTEKIEVDRTQVQVNNLEADSIRAYNGLLIAEQLLKFTMSLPIDRPIVLTDTALSDVLTRSVSLLDGTTRYENRVDYSLLQTALKLTEFDVKRYRFKALPTVAAFGSAAYTYSANELKPVLQPKNYLFYSLVGLRLEVPIFNGFQRKAQLEQALLTVERTRNNINFLKRNIDFQSAQARTGLRNALLGLQTNERNVTLANSVLDLARRKYKAGVGSNLEVTQAQSELLQSQNRLFTAQLDVINATTDLQRAQGLFR